MKRINISLAIGITHLSLLIFWNIIKFVSHLFSIIGEIPIKYLTLSEILPNGLLILTTILALLLFFKNLKMKKSKLLSIIIICISSLKLVVSIFTLVTPAIPQYLIYSKLGLIDTYFTIFLSYLSSGGLFGLIGVISCLVGGIISLIKKQPKVNVIQFES